MFEKRTQCRLPSKIKNSERGQIYFMEPRSKPKKRVAHMLSNGGLSSQGTTSPPSPTTPTPPARARAHTHTHTHARAHVFQLHGACARTHLAIIPHNRWSSDHIFRLSCKITYVSSAMSRGNRGLSLEKATVPSSAYGTPRTYAFVLTPPHMYGGAHPPSKGRSHRPHAH